MANAEPTDPLEMELAKTCKELESRKEWNQGNRQTFTNALSPTTTILSVVSAKEVLEASGRGIEQLVRKLLPVLDSFDSAFRQLTAADVDKKVAGRIWNVDPSNFGMF